MKRSSSRGLGAGVLAVVLAVGITTPASAVTLRLGTSNGTCLGDGYASGAGATVHNVSCTEVRASVTYIDSGGTIRTAFGSWNSNSSSVNPPSSMTVGRAGRGNNQGALSSWISY